jgi:hypothetical protein
MHNFEAGNYPRGLLFTDVAAGVPQHQATACSPPVMKRAAMQHPKHGFFLMIASYEKSSDSMTFTT